jgi:REP element-mobilizing transposase RayT
MVHPEKYYHIYNHANGNENLFVEDKNYCFFLELLKKFLPFYIDIYAYCLMPNHCHLAIKSKSVEVILENLGSEKLHQFKNEQEQYKFVLQKISNAFSNLFSSYTQSFNKVYNRRGSLFNPNFKQVEVKNDLHFCNLIFYIHKNSVHHGFVKHIEDWPYSSYNGLLNHYPAVVEYNKVIDIFGSKAAFIHCHKQTIELKSKLED